MKLAAFLSGGWLVLLALYMIGSTRTHDGRKTT